MGTIWAQSTFPGVLEQMKELANLLKTMVPAERIELSWAEARGILSPVRLPVSPRRHAITFSISDQYYTPYS